MSRILPLTRWRMGMAWALAIVCWLAPGPAQADGAGPDRARGPGLSVILSREFFEAMNRLSQPGATYGDRQEVWLEKIALSSQYVVKTNLTLIQQQERIIRLLEELTRQRPPQEGPK